MNYPQQRIDLAAAFRWAVRLNYHEAVANHFSLVVNDDATQSTLPGRQRRKWKHIRISRNGILMI